MADTGSIIDRVGVQVTVDQDNLRAGLMQAGTHIDNFARKAGTALKAVSIAAVGIGAAFAGFAAGVGLESLKRVGTALEDIGVKAKTMGIMTSELQELGHAARRVDVDAAMLDAGLQKFSVTLGMARAGTGALASFLKEVNPALLEQLKSTTTLTGGLNLLADAHNQLSSQQDKLALTQAAFSRSGVEMSRVLDLGSDGMAEMAREANKLNFVFSDLEIQAGGRLADSIEEASKAFDHQLKKAIVGLEPVIVGFIDLGTMVIATLRGIAREIKNIFSTSTSEQIKGLGTQADMLKTKLDGLNKNLTNPLAGGMHGQIKQQIERAQGELDVVNKQIADAEARLLKEKQDSVGPFTTTIVGGKPAPTTSEAEAARKEAEALAKEKETAAQALHNAELEKYNNLLREGGQLKTELQTPDEALQARQDKINQLFRAGAIDVETFGRAMAQASAFSSQNMDALASSVSQNLSTIFGESKGVAIATAVINTAQGVTRALAQYPPPISFAMAAIQAAAGAAQIAKIRSMTKSGGGAGGGSGAPAVAGGGVTQAQMVNISLQGNNFSRDSVAGLIGMINQQVKDGTKLIVSTS